MKEILLVSIYLYTVYRCTRQLSTRGFGSPVINVITSLHSCTTSRSTLKPSTIISSFPVSSANMLAMENQHSDTTGSSF